MARGYPDFFGFSIFPFYGAIQHSGWGVKACPDGAETEVIELSGKGRIAGGRTGLYTAGNLANAIWRVYIDGVMIESMAASTGVVYGLIHGLGAVLYMTYYDPVTNPNAWAIIAPDQTFGQSWKLSVSNAAGAEVSCNYSVLYTLYN